MPKFKDLSGLKFGKLLVLQKNNQKSSTNKNRWNCECECGNLITVISAHLSNGNTKSCGCHKKETSRINGINSTIHGKSHMPVYRSWDCMKQRCTNTNDKEFKNYGARGITICDRWINSFENFYSDMGDKPTKSHTLDRKDVNANYDPSNCVWSTPKEQGNNRRNNTLYSIRGKNYTQSQILEKSGLSINRLKNISEKNKLDIIYIWERFAKHGYEISSKGDYRFSAFNAKLPNGFTIEEFYQCTIKGYDPGGRNWKLGKGKPPLDKTKDLWKEYLNLWKIWVNNNPLLIKELQFLASKSNYILTDRFATTDVNQARALATILNEITWEIPKQ